MNKDDLEVGRAYITEDDVVIFVTAVTVDVIRAVPALLLNAMARDLDTRIQLIQAIIGWDVIVAQTTRGRWVLLCDEDAPVWSSHGDGDEVDVIPAPGLQIADGSIGQFWRTRRLQMEEVLPSRA